MVAARRETEPETTGSLRVAHHLERARALLDRRPEAALKHAWRAATIAARRRDDSSLRSLGAIGREVESRIGSKGARNAHTLARFCDEAVEDNYLRSQGLSSRLWSRSKVEVKSCPDCAETILARANVCRFCGYRFAEAQAPGSA
jgi:hypothetical protein